MSGSITGSGARRPAAGRTGRPAVSGANALALGGRPEQAQAPRRRTVLSVVPAAAGRRRVPFAVLCFMFLVAALATVLVLNISVSSGQYRLVQLQNERTELAQRNEALSQRVESHQAPQNLAARAAELGMVPAGAVGAVDLQTLDVTGTPAPAAEGGKVPSRVPAPAVLTDPVLPPGAAAPDPAPEPARAAEQRAGQGESAPAPAAAEAPAPAAAEPEPELNGGTIPAPVQRSGQ
ncbi:Cell division protein FtsL [Arthrobacter saudimassiliensis]|uniref:Cell division protein FtsL n=1 Tax=Arthrobacter saudimassiliensis TaxID=1461584 RepID=A0A078MQV7_9MICC|nr:Cell division protein FtsL [Arthrobacter saudimassiliensis]